MFKEACAVSALVAAALAPSMASQALGAQAHTGATMPTTPTTSVALADCAAGRAPKCKWLEEGNKRCYYCRDMKGGGFKKQYCEQKTQKQEQSTERECTTTKEPLPASPNRTCKTCTDAKTGKVLSRECNS
ncbi:hypothetical protein ACIA8R_43560 [Nonomuraea sp. NPDC051191]|uniref:hypothetical protein n=1 Tax=Nonomuraea sp. NPDC051191 TaxID=3364372 RepID=UPI003791F542